MIPAANENAPQTILQKVTTVLTDNPLPTTAAGMGGVAQHFVTFNEGISLIQAMSVLVGFVLICGQAVLFFRGFARKWKTGRPSNDR